MTRMPTIRLSLFVTAVALAASSWSSCQAFTVTTTSSLSTRLDLQFSKRKAAQASSMLYSSSTNSVTGADTNLSGRQLVFQGMEAFRAGQLTESIQLFDQAAIVQPSMQPFLWQRGISLYYADKFDLASRQFQTDVTVNPLDVEEIVWDIACQLRMRPDTLPPAGAMSLPAGKTDSRRIMGPVYQLFRGQGSEQELAVAGHTSQKPSDVFYALFYLGLFAEARGETTKAENYLQSAVATPYAVTLGRGDYMTTVARIHCQLRRWA